MPDAPPLPPPIIAPLGDRGLLVRFAQALDIEANRIAIAAAGRLGRRAIAGVEEIAPNLVSVLVRYDPAAIGFSALAGEIRLALAAHDDAPAESRAHRITIAYGGQAGPDLESTAETLGLSPEAFIAAHGRMPLRVLAVGFAPGFLYCGMHDEDLVIPRREAVRASVPAGSILFAAGQTAIAATPLPTGWSVIGRSDFLNFDPDADPPTRARAGDTLVFEPAS